MGFSSGNNNSLMSEINVTPFVDVMLVLLIIFMVAAPMMIQGVDVKLPETTSQPLKTDKEPLIITIDRNQSVYLNEVKIETEFLGEKLKKIFEGQTNPEVFFQADKDVAYGAVVDIMSKIKEAGVANLGMVTDPIDRAKKKTQ